MPDHETYMQRALTLAQATEGFASPNPKVGCVLVKDESVIAEGAHLYDQRDHAEIAALKQAAALGRDVAGATAYVTLEPCSHHGRTGPCAEALIHAGITECIIATADSNPIVSGKGIAKLRKAGLQVTVGILEQPARDLNEAFSWSIQHGTPFVTLKSALSVDGFLAPRTRTETAPVWLTGPEARAEVHRLRHASDAILTGIGTVLADDPHLTDRSGLPRRRPLLRVVLDPALRIPITSNLIQSAAGDLLLIHGGRVSRKRIHDLAQTGAMLRRLDATDGLSRRQLSLPALLEHLATLDIRSVLLESGPTLNGAFLTQHLVQKTILFFSETELGPEAIPFAHGIPSPFLFKQTLSRITRTTFGPDACVTGCLQDPWSNIPKAELI